MIKVRNFAWILGWLMSIIYCEKSNSQIELAGDSTSISVDTGFLTVEVAIDSLWLWTCNPKNPRSDQLMPENIFVQMAREKDTVSPMIILHGQYVNYRYRFTKGMENVQKSMKKKGLKPSKIEFNKTELLYYNNSGGAPSIRAEVPIIYRNKKYLFRTILLLYKKVYYPSGDLELRYIKDLPKEKRKKP